MDCIFCKIAKGEIPCHKVHEDDDFLCFLDINPRNKGHALVIPKQHFRWVWDVSNVGRYYENVTKIANALKKAFSTDFVVSYVIGEEVPHAHIHVVPRFKGDGHGSFINLGIVKQFSDEEMKRFVDAIKNALG